MKIEKVKNIETKQKEESFVVGEKVFEVFVDQQKIGYVWKADGSWWANDEAFDESIEQFKNKNEAIKWLSDYSK